MMRIEMFDYSIIV